MPENCRLIQKVNMTIKPKQILTYDSQIKILQREFNQIKFLVNQFFSGQSLYWPEKEIRTFKKLLIKNLSDGRKNKETNFKVSAISASFHQLIDTWQRWLKEKEMGKFGWDIKREEFKKSLENFENFSKTDEFKIRKTFEALFLQFKNLSGNSSIAKEVFMNKLASLYSKIKSQNPGKRIRFSIVKKGGLPTIRAEAL